MNGATIRAIFIRILSPGGQAEDLPSQNLDEMKKGHAQLAATGRGVRKQQS